MKAALRIIVAVGASLLSLAAKAQFVGDVFFVVPSVAIAQGGTGQLQLALFTGNRAFGAASTELAFDAAAIEVVDVTATANGAITGDLKWEKTSTGIRILLVNGKSMTDPFGTVVLATVTVRPLATAGSVVQVSSSVRQALDVAKAAYPAGTGFGAEVSVGTVAASSARAQGLDVGSASHAPAILARALRLRPAGHQVDIYVPVASATFAKTPVRTPPSSPNAESETSQHAK